VSQAAAFYRDVARSRVLYTIRDDRGFPAPRARDGQRAHPFWSSRAAAEAMLAGPFPAHELVEIPWDEFKTQWATGLGKDRMLVALDWGGPGSEVTTVKADTLVKSVAAIR
jgi:hypothetical protein